MLLRTTLLTAAALRRLVTAACVLLLMVVAFSPVCANDAAPMVSDAAAMSTGDRPDTPVHPDGSTCLDAHHLCGKATPIPPMMPVADFIGALSATKPVWAPGPVLLPGLTELPIKPPRA